MTRARTTSRNSSWEANGTNVICPRNGTIKWRYRQTKRSLSSRRDASNSLLARGKLAMCIYRQKLKRILQKRAARSYCSLPPRQSACSTNLRQRRLGFFTLPVENKTALWAMEARSHYGNVPSTMSALGQKQTSQQHVQSMSALPPKADISRSRPMSQLALTSA